MPPKPFASRSAPATGTSIVCSEKGKMKTYRTGCRFYVTELSHRVYVRDNCVIAEYYVLVNNNALCVLLRQYVSGASSALHGPLRLDLLHGYGADTGLGSSLRPLPVQQARLLGPDHEYERYA